MDINQTERKIAALLADLEKSSEAIVKGISIEDINITTFADEKNS